jgi:flagellar basal-body rod modification protein FlgD
MNALVAIRALGDETRAVSSAKRARVAQDVATQQSSTKATDALAAQVKAAQTATPSTKAAEAEASAAKGSESTSTKATESTSDSTTARVLNKELDRDAFLQLLVYQLQNQDPLNPTDNSQMIAQLAQFSALEQMNNLNESFTTVSGSIDRLNFVSASALVGRTVSGTDLNGNVIEGTVQRVYMGSDNSVYLMVGTTPVALTNIQRIDGVAS